MSTIIRTQNFPMTDAIRSHLAKRMTYALRPFESSIVSTEVFCKELDRSSRKGDEKSVLIKIRLKGESPLVVEYSSDDLYLAITVAARRAKRVVKRSLRRRQRFERKSLRKEAFDAATGIAGMRRRAATQVAGH